MNIAFFLTPKNEVIYEYLDATMRQVIERMEHHGYTAIPLIDKEGKYVGTLSEGDLLWKLKNTADLTFDNIGEVPVSDIQKHVHNESVLINAEMEDMLTLAADQNFVPVIDKEGVFVGIIRRKDIIEYYTRNITD